MKKVFIILLLLIGIFIYFTPVDSYAINIHSFEDYFSNSFSILDEKKDNEKTKENSGIGSVEDAGIDMDQYNQDQSCETLLGDPNKEDSVAWLLQKVLDIVKIVGPLLVVVLSSVDFAKVIVNSDDDAMAKAAKKLAIRLVLAAALFFIPVLTTALLDVFGIMGEPTCNIQ